ESVIGLYKTELIKPRRPWQGLDDLELATAEWVDWFNRRRPFEYCDDLTPVEAEQAHYAHHQTRHRSESQTRKSPDSPGRFRPASYSSVVDTESLRAPGALLRRVCAQADPRGLLPSRGHSNPPARPLDYNWDLTAIGPMARSGADLSLLLTSRPSRRHERRTAPGPRRPAAAVFPC
ncbi:MAG: hypothetical protein JWP66_2014, partial [Naasia sp.]|nr:hypothetical protein [Naasia sp.]